MRKVWKIELKINEEIINAPFIDWINEIANELQLPEDKDCQEILKGIMIKNVITQWNGHSLSKDDIKKELLNNPKIKKLSRKNKFKKLYGEKENDDYIIINFKVSNYFV